MKRRAGFKTVAVIAAALVAMTAGASAAWGDQADDSPPYWGADLIFDCQAPSCSTVVEASTGFPLYDGHSAYVTTAGHFGPVGTFLLTGAGTVGRVQQHNSIVDTDVAPASGANGIVWTSNSTSRTVYNWETTNQDAVGHKVCIDGAVTAHEMCGATIVALNQPWMGGNDGVLVQCASTTQCSQGGDSGAPVYAVFTSGAHVGQVEAVGINVGGGPNGDGTYIEEYIPIRYIMSWVWTFNRHTNLLCVICSPEP